MKVTALVPDALVARVREFAGGKNITDSLVKALSDWTAAQELKSLNRRLARNPLVFRRGFNANSVRKASRR